MRAPEHIAAVIDALQFDTPVTHRLEVLPESEWGALLEWCDAKQLTLLLHGFVGSKLPSRLREQMESRRASYLVRFKRLKQELLTVTEVFSRAGLEFCVLKGLTHSPILTPDPVTRTQGDIDIWLQPSAISSARRLLIELGYRTIGNSTSRHIDPMARPSSWKWRGDYFDPDMPIAIEVHYELWSERAEGIPAPGQQGFWDRKISKVVDGCSWNILCDVDVIGFAALHLLLHVLHGELPVQRAWEIGRFLHEHAQDARFWQLWRKSHGPELRQLETIAFWLVTTWFGCTWPSALDTELQNLPAVVSRWLETFSSSPLFGEWQPNKNEVWLHLALVKDFRTKARILLRRLMPVHGRTLQLARLRHHLVTLLPTIAEGLRRAVSPRVYASEDPGNRRGQNKQIQARRPLL